MSLRSLQNRRIGLQGPVVDDEDAYGNEVVVPTPSTPATLVRARRDQVSAAEDVTDRDQQTQTFEYLVALRDEDGVEVAPVGRGWVIDGEDLLEIVGEPELIRKRHRPHHWELRAVLRTG